MSKDQEIETEAKSLLSTHNLIMALLFVAGSTFGLFVWDAERALDKLDKVDVNSGNTAAQVEVLVNKVDTLGNQYNALAGTVTDHEKRITVLETVDARRAAGPRSR